MFRYRISPVSEHGFVIDWHADGHPAERIAFHRSDFPYSASLAAKLTSAASGGGLPIRRPTTATSQQSPISPNLPHNTKLNRNPLRRKHLFMLRFVIFRRRLGVQVAGEVNNFEPAFPKVAQRIFK